MGEKCPVNFAVKQRVSRYLKDLLHAANLRHGTDGFTSPPNKGMLMIFSPANLGTKGQHANP
jgi:hypothetical protein